MKFKELQYCYPLPRPNLPSSIDQIPESDIVACVRPFREGGPRLEMETIGNKLLVHNYGHGGSGLTLAWGYAEEAADLVAQAAGPPEKRRVSFLGYTGLETAEIAVLGRGVIGMIRLKNRS